MIYPNTLLLNRYLIVRQIGQSTVYEAIDQRLSHRVALKQIIIKTPEQERAFEREAYILTHLNHPTLPYVSDYFSERGSFFLVMQYIPSDDLESLLRKQGYPFQLELVVKWCDQLLDALEYLHTQSPPIIHGDIKPANLKLSSQGNVMLLDFGIFSPAYALDYAPPEQIYRQGMDARSDLYSLAATLYYLLTGTKGPASTTRASAQITHSPDPLLPANLLNSQIPTLLASLLTQTMSLNPAQRLQSAAVMRVALLQASRSNLLPTSTSPHLSPPQRKKRALAVESSKRWWGIVGILAWLAAVSLLLLIIINLFSSSSENKTDSAAVVSSPNPSVTRQAAEESGATSQEAQPSPTTEVIESAPSVTIAVTTEVTSPSPSPIVEPTLTPIPIAGSTRLSEKDGMTQLFVPAGEFLMGSLNDQPQAEEYEKPPRTIYLDAFWIDQTEISNAMFARFVEETGYETRAELEGESYVYVGEEKWELVEGANWQYPQGPDCGCADEEWGAYAVVQISWNDAQMYCQWAGRRLPTEAEWEKAARGSDGRIYPWGNQEVAGNLVNYCDNNCLLDSAARHDDDGYKFTAPVGSYPDAASAFGALDMAGNAWEWVADWYDSSYYNYSPQSNPQGAEIGAERVLRGGSWSNGFNWVRSAHRYHASPTNTNDERGFRCASSP